jgi:hypothetical protein
LGTTTLKTKYVNGKMIPVETVLGMGKEGDKGEWWRG